MIAETQAVPSHPPEASGARSPTLRGRRAVVIGGGLAGLASAAELASRGARVTLVEKNAHLGGKMNVLTEETDAGQFTFDMGPTILTLPEVLCGLIRRCGGRVRDYIDLVRLDPQWRCHFEASKAGGPVTVDLYEGVDRMQRHLDETFPGQGVGDGYERLVEYSRRMNRLSRGVFFYRDIGGVLDVMRGTPMGDTETMKDVMAMRLHSTVAATARRYVREPRILQIVEHFLQYVGSSPFLAPAILTMIASAQVDQGCWYPMGGTRRVAATLERLCGEQGVRLVTGRGVERIVTDTEGGRTFVKGVVLDDGSTLPADAVVSNCDVQRTLRGMMEGPAAQAEARRVAKRYEPACSGVVLYLGLDRQYESLAHHNFFFSKDSHQEFADIYERGVPARDPTLYVAAPSRTDPGQAPAGCESLYILVHTPYTRPGSVQADTERLLREYRPVIMDKLVRMGLNDVESRIRVERALTPAGIERMYNAEGGAIYGLASHGRLGGGFKPKNRSSIARGLYFAGGSVNPGPGMPMVMMSGVTAADAAAADMCLPAADLAGTSGEPAAGEFRRGDEPAPITATGAGNVATIGPAATPRSMVTA